MMNDLNDFENELRALAHTIQPNKQFADQLQQQLVVFQPPAPTFWARVLGKMGVRTTHNAAPQGKFEDEPAHSQTILAEVRSAPVRANAFAGALVVLALAFLGGILFISQGGVQPLGKPRRFVPTALATAPQPRATANAPVGTVIKLEGAELVRYKPNDMVSLEILWRITKPTNALLDYRLAMHVLDSDGNLISQVDEVWFSRPIWNTDTAWVGMPERKDFRLPAGNARLPTTLRMAVVDGKTGARVPVQSSLFSVKDNWITLSLFTFNLNWQAFRTHTVKTGDTVFGIAQTFGVDVENLIIMNQLSNPDAIRIGQLLRIPPQGKNWHESFQDEANPTPASQPVIALTPTPKLKLNSFTLSNTRPRNNDTLTATWSFEGEAERVSIVVWENLGPVEYLARWARSTNNTSSLTFHLQSMPSQTVTVQLVADKQVLAEQDIVVQCGGAWFFDLPANTGLSTCPNQPPTKTAAAIQRFERGQMVWLQSENRVFVLFDYAEVDSFTNNFSEGMPESDPNLVPPKNLLQPVRGFGWVWRSYPAVRQKLGWALEPEQGFQSCTAATNYATYFAAPDWRIYEISQGWRKLTTPQGDAVLAKECK